MELVPIIYTVLQIVIVLAFFAITISYTIYKIRQKNGLIETPAQRLANPVIKAEESVKKVVQRITKPIQYHPQQNPLPKEQVVLPQQHKEVVEKPRHHLPKSESKRKDSHDAFDRKEKPRSGGDRIEIVKNLTPGKPQQEKEIRKPRKRIDAKPPEEKKLGTLGDDVIDKYSDDEDNDMFTLNVKE